MGVEVEVSVGEDVTVAVGVMVGGSVGVGVDAAVGVLEGSNVGDGELMGVSVFPGAGVRVEVGGRLSGVSAVGEGDGLSDWPESCDTAGVVPDESGRTGSRESEHSETTAPVAIEAAAIEAVRATARA